MQLKDLIVSKCNIRDIEDDDASIPNLAESIKAQTLISKMVLRPAKGGKFEVIAGGRRWRALEAINGQDYELKETEYVVMDLDDDQALILSIEENTQRLNLSPIELNRAALKLNQMGKSNKEIARILNIYDARLKRIMAMSQTLNKMPEVAKAELRKTPDQAKLTDSHWEKISKEEDKDVIKDVVDYIIEKEASAKDIPGIITAIKKTREQIDGEPKEEKGGKKTEVHEGGQPEGPIEYEHKGELTLEVHDGKEILKVIGKGEDEREIPIDHYLEYLRHPDKFKVSVKFKMTVKPY